MSKTNESADILSMFGLTFRQTVILFSIEKFLVEKDISTSKKDKGDKQKWLDYWTVSIKEYLDKLSPEESSKFLTREEIVNAIVEDQSKDINNTWYYLIMLEATLFVPYTPLGKYVSDDKIFSGLKYQDQKKEIKELVRENKIMDEDFIDRFEDTYSKSISKISGKATKIALGVVSTVAVAAIIAATAGVLAGPIAVALFGSQFVGLSGAALTAACLAMAGGGAIAIGGTGMIGGIAAIVGGGALLGMAGSGAALGAVTLFVASTPQLALTQAAKLEVVLKEIVINAQKDIKSAQSVLENYKNQIVKLNGELASIRLDNDNNTKTIENIKKSLEYMEKAYKSSRVFVSSYGVGVGEMN